VATASSPIRREENGGKDGKWTVKALATEVGLTESHFCRIFKKVMGMTVGVYRNSILLGHADHLPEVVGTDGQYVFDFDQHWNEPLRTPRLPDKYGYEGSVYLANFESTELEENWLQFASMHPAMVMFNPPCTTLDMINSEPLSRDHLFDAENIGISEDDFQFLNLDYLDTPAVVS
jgi:Bacterial regulatory helix-turn-helix proteins, AraC family